MCAEIQTEQRIKPNLTIYIPPATDSLWTEQVLKVADRHLICVCVWFLLYLPRRPVSDNLPQIHYTLSCITNWANQKDYNAKTITILVLPTLQKYVCR